MSFIAASLRPKLIEVVEALGLALMPVQLDTLIGYLDLLQRWNGVYNLTAVRDPFAMLTQHLADCLAIVRPLARAFGDAAASVIDVGSGGGLPAVVIAVALPQLQVTSVDSVGKKAAFVRQAASELHLTNLNAVHTRIEALRAPPADLITARAFSSLAEMTRLSEHLLAPGGCWMAMKGRRPNDEITALASRFEVFHVEQLAVPGLAAERCLVWLRRTQPTQDASL